VKAPAGDFFSADPGSGLGNAADAARLSRAQNTAARVDDSALRLIGNSAAMQKVRDLIGRVAPKDSTVLI
jgi:DNA-binding NtrC family response regulator